MQKKLNHLTFPRQLLIVPIAAITAYLFWVASYLKIDYHDAYFIFLNSRCVATLNPLGYTGYRPIVLPIVLSPIFYLEKFGISAETVFRLCHLTMVGFFALLIWVTYRLFRLKFGRENAL